VIENPILKTVDRMSNALADFFWDSFVALKINGISGDYVEFGSWGANSLQRAYQAINAIGPPRHCWAFDSFSGLPDVESPFDDHPVWSSHVFGNEGQGGVAKFHDACAEKGVPPDAYTAIEGYYEDSLPAIGDGAPDDIALAYIDCNMYSSTVTVLEFLAPRLKHGMIVGFDDYFLWSPRQVSGERAALEQFCARHPEWHFQRYRDIHYAGLAFVVERADWLENA
jgi:O-methyltransferase